ncbi:hypothetical protein [uncultured Phascolarctobacterium sp.]|jgi:hypothetical protein|uniref:Virion assembly protein n=1 Tax=Caudovirales sp. ctIZM3 TaxID=2827633 RepID=A0A8S5T857_9CAUD|nr:hypothetical protein [uncultured Phascolarctobacterium sp.]DAF59422.1 MAG TPA: virion assembly protein [Caudovirales sp. ctIZM3]
MCGKKPKIEAAPAAAPVAAPTETNTQNLETEGTTRQKKAAGKKKLIVGKSTSGTGVNI